MAKRLDDWDAFVVLFAISFGPAFVAVDLTVNRNGSDLWITIATMIGILIFFLFNIVTIHMLVDVYTTKTLGSYQEVAYSISRGNRGYIFLISAMKAIYLAVTASFCLEFCASYLTTLIGVAVGLPDPSAAKWAIYIGCLVIFSLILLWIFLGCSDECFTIAKWPARGVFYSAIISIVLLVLILIPYWIFPTFTNFMAK